jgi:hypothetical protein
MAFRVIRGVGVSGDLGSDDFDREGIHGFGEALEGGFVIADADDGTA